MCACSLSAISQDDAIMAHHDSSWLIMAHVSCVHALCSLSAISEDDAIVALVAVGQGAPLSAVGLPRTLGHNKMESSVAWVCTSLVRVGHGSARP